MKILFASSEAHPLAKTGGLGDVSASLPLALHQQGIDIALVVPAYRSALRAAAPLEMVAVFDHLPGSEGPVRLLRGRFPGSDMALLLVDAPHLFDRDGGPYLGPNGLDWPDNPERFTLFCRVVVELAQDRLGLDWRPDLLHLNDWQTGLAAALLAQEAERPATIFTIHNLAYRGLYDAETFHRLHLPESLAGLHGLEFFGGISLMKGGLLFADWITTVSPTYAREIRTHAYGWWLEGLLESRADRLVGILNGIDYREWDPATDPHLPAHYQPDSMAGKAECKRALQQAMGLEVNPQLPLLGHIGRLVDQKGVDLLLSALSLLKDQPLQVVILGSGDRALEQSLVAAAAVAPERIAVRIGYSEVLAHQIEAGADLFVMPSRFEPCGLNQLYSLRYGTVPVVRNTGGLADSVVETTRATLADGSATGFLFNPPDPAALSSTIREALACYRNRSCWQSLIRNGMGSDFSWSRSAEAYVDLYRKALGVSRT
jgi:starch synthase